MQIQIGTQIQTLQKILQKNTANTTIIPSSRERLTAHQRQSKMLAAAISSHQPQASIKLQLTLTNTNINTRAKTITNKVQIQIHLPIQIQRKAVF